MSDKKNMLNGSEAVKMEINSKAATNSCDFSQCSSSGTTVAQETGNLKLRSKICDLNWVRERDWETETEADIISALCIVCFSRSHAHSQLRVLFWFLCCFRILVVLKFRASAVETGSGTQDQTERATSSQCTHLLYESLVSFRRAGSFYVFCN